jgi:hypothetical protein
MQIPELDTTSVSWIAYYDTGLDSMNAELMAGAGSATKITGYDDGVELNYSGPTRDYTIRGSDNGWVTAHMDRTENYATNQGSPDGINGVHDIVDWTDPNSESSIKNNVLERSIYNCLQELDKWSSISYSDTDVGLYNYQYKSGNVSLFSNQVSGDGRETPTFQYTESTDFKVVAVGSAGNTWYNYHPYFSTYAGPKTDKIKLTDVNAAERKPSRYGAAKFLSLNPGTKFVVDMENTHSNTEISAHAVAIWD